MEQVAEYVGVPVHCADNIFVRVLTKKHGVDKDYRFRFFCDRKPQLCGLQLAEVLDLISKVTEWYDEPSHPRRTSKKLAFAFCGGV